MIDEVRGYRSGLEISTIYIGGGSPSCIGVEQLCRLVDAVYEHFEVCGRVEFTVEANPGQVGGAWLERMKGCGVNRLSFGAQSFDEGELKLLGRAHGVEDVYAAFELARGAGYDNLSIDLMFALPGGTVEVFAESLDAAVGLGVEHVSAYSLSYEEGSDFMRELLAGRIERVCEEVDRAMYERAIEVLAGAGYEHYEISNFAKAGFECRHNMAYWANDDYIGIGPSAASWFGGKRYTNVADIGEYVAGIDSLGRAVAESSEPTVIEVACETAVLNLRRRAGIDVHEFVKRTGYEVFGLFGGEISCNAQAGLLEVCDDRVRLTDEGIMVADRVLADFSVV